MAGTYYLMVKGKSFGPLRAEHFPTLAQEGLVTQDSLVRERGSSEIRPLHGHPELTRIMFGSKASLVRLKGRLEDARTGPLVGLAASLLIGVLGTMR